MSIYLDKSGAEIDVTGLPEELIDELTCIPDGLEAQVLSLMPQDGSGITLDAILIGLYRKYGLIRKRRFMQNKLYRMKELDTAEDSNGIYTLHPALVEKPSHNDEPD